MNIFFVFIFIVLGSHVAQSADNSSTVADSLSVWSKKAEENPGNALAYFNLGVLYHQQKNWELARLNYNKVIELGSPLSSVAEYYLAQIDYTQANLSSAKTLLAKINMDEVPENFKKRVLLFKNKLYSEDLENSETALPKKEEQSFFLNADISAGQNSNPLNAADAQSSSNSADQARQIQADAYLTLAHAETYDFGAAYSYSSLTFSKETSSDYSYHAFSLPLALYMEDLKIKISPDYFIDNYGGSAFSQSSGGLISITKKLNSTYIGISLLTSAISNKTATYSYLSGRQSKFGIFVDQKWNHSGLSFSAALNRLSYQDTASLASSYNSLPLSFSYNYFQSGFSLDLSLLFEFKKFDKASAAPNFRVDTKIATELNLAYHFNPNFKIFTDLSYINNTSNFNNTNNDYNYKQSQTLIGLGLSY